jgi:hypothetical protein
MSTLIIAEPVLKTSLFNLSRGTRQLQTYIPSGFTATTNLYGLQMKSSHVVCYNSSSKYFEIKRIKG